MKREIRLNISEDPLVGGAYEVWMTEGDTSRLVDSFDTLEHAEEAYPENEDVVLKEDPRYFGPPEREVFLGFQGRPLMETIKDFPDTLSTLTNNTRPWPKITGFIMAAQEVLNEYNPSIIENKVFTLRKNGEFWNSINKNYRKIKQEDMELAKRCLKSDTLIVDIEGVR